MRNKPRLLSFGVLVFLAAASFASATSLPVRGGSNYGSLNSYQSCLASSEPCEGFQQGFMTNIGGQPYQVFQFAYNADTFPIPSVSLDVFEIGNISASTSSPFTFFLPLVDNTMDAGVFFCNNGTNNFAASVMSSQFPNGQPLTGLPCTVGAPSTANFSVTPVTGGIDLNFTGDFTDTTLFTIDGNLSSSTVSAPEPASLLLLGAGLFAVGIGRRGKSTTSSKA